MTKKLPRSFYTRPNVVQIAKELLGKNLFTYIDGHLCGGIIVETEAYSGENDKACHSHLGRRTKRTEIMYHKGGLAYVYLTYGIHYLFNMVTNEEGKADAVLIRAIEPKEGIEWMLERRNMEKPDPKLTAGPGVLSQALGISREHYGLDLTGDTIWVEDKGFEFKKNEIEERPRVGISYAGEDALLPWRFSVPNNPWVSKAVTNYGNRNNRTNKEKS